MGELFDPRICPKIPHETNNDAWFFYIISFESDNLENPKNRRFAQFHHAETHTVVLIKNIMSPSSPELTQTSPTTKPSHFESTIGSPSSISTAREHRHSRNLSGGSSGPIFAPGSSAGLSISTISASVETIKAGANGKAMRLSYAEAVGAPTS